MKPERTDPTTRLDDALDQLPRGIEPARDLWPAIEAQLEPRDGRAGLHRFWPAAAAVLRVVGSSLVTAVLLSRDEATVARQLPATDGAVVTAAALRPARAPDPAYVAAREELARSLAVRIERMQPAARRQLEKNLAEMHRASTEISTALQLSPGDPLLEELLLNAYQDELAVLASLNQLTGSNGAGATTDATRMQL
jgi:hypothetical protein